jgi:signal transduction histidine kinase
VGNGSGPRTVAAVRRLNRRLEARVEQQARWLVLLHEVTTAVNEAVGFADAARATLGLICRAEGWQFGQVYVADQSTADRFVLVAAHTEDDRFEGFHDASPQAVSAGDSGLAGRAAAGQVVWVNGSEAVRRALPKRAIAAVRVRLTSALGLPIVAGPHLLGVVELLSNRSHRRSLEVMRLMEDLGAQLRRLIQREHAMARVAELAWSQQQEMVQVLHDTLGQELTGLGMLSSSLAQTLQSTDPAAADIARQVTDGARRTLGLVRQLARGMFPVDVDAEGLAVALARLARTSAEVHRVPCRFEQDGALLIEDNRLATQLYRIVQEAVTNALRHANPSEIVIRAQTTPGVVALSVADDGVGLGDRASNTEGVGLRIMRYRAMTIGGRLDVQAGLQGGTVVTCVVREASAPARTQEKP